MSKACPAWAIASYCHNHSVIQVIAFCTIIGSILEIAI